MPKALSRQQASQLQENYHQATPMHADSQCTMLRRTVHGLTLLVLEQSSAAPANYTLPFQLDALPHVYLPDPCRWQTLLQIVYDEPEHVQTGGGLVGRQAPCWHQRTPYICCVGAVIIA